MLRINEVRFLQDLSDLARIGRLPEAEGGGLDRRPFSLADRAARDFFQHAARTAGLATRIDAAANLSAMLPASRESAQTLMLGSHLDTVPNGGPYDGALGVVAALEVLRTIKEAEMSLPFHLEAIAFTDEEGRFGDFFGSQAMIGGHTPESIGRFLSAARAFPEDLAAMRRAVPGGLTPSSIPAAARDPATIAGFLELHVEQGPQLELAAVPIGVVDAIFGRRSMRLDFRGRSDHAGTTPLHLRADALVAASRFVVQAPQLAQSSFADSVVTCGNVIARPGVYNVVPGEVTVLVEFRAAEEETLSQMEQALMSLAQESAAGSKGLSVSAEATGHQEPVALDQSMQAAVRRACVTLETAHLTLSSGALHDAGCLAAIAPSVLVFVPSKGGRSHCPDEDTDAADLVAGANVLLHTVLVIAGQADGV